MKVHGIFGLICVCVCVCVCMFMEKYILFQVIRIGLRGILLNVSGTLANVYSWLCREGGELVWEWK